jgi:hypothetical protein
MLDELLKFCRPKRTLEISFLFYPLKEKKPFFRERLTKAETHSSIHSSGGIPLTMMKSINKHQVVAFYADETL